MNKKYANIIDPDDPLVKQREKNNPYRFGFAEIVKRLCWDLYLDSWTSREKLRKKKNKFNGEKAVILCNGPSLLDTNFSLLKESRVYSFGLNKINLLFDKTDFRTSCIVAVNPFVIEQNAEFFNDTEIDLYLDSYARRKNLIKSRRNIVYLHSSGIPKFAKDVSISVNQGHTVTFVAMQLAFHMGFKEVALVGADHSFAISGPANKTVVSGAHDESHFDTNYFSDGMKWQLPDLFESEVWYGRARNIFEAHGRNIINCTHGGKLEVFRRYSLANFLSS